jgi:hypothetical protein
MASRYLSLVLLALLTSPAQCSDSIYGFYYQSHLNSASVFFNMFTLCLAPLAAHVVFGLCPTLVMGENRPPWHDLLFQFNPVSILWRYYATAYRRVRVVNWDSEDLAATNTIFWYEGRWDGSESVLQKSRGYLVSPPEKPYTKAISASSLSSFTVAFQGAQALAILIQLQLPNPNASFGSDLTTLFFPLALIGILRLPAAPWLTNEHAYAYSDETKKAPQQSSTRVGKGASVWTASPAEQTSGYLATNHWKCILYRLWWALSILGVMGLGLYTCFHQLQVSPGNTVYFSTTLLLEVLMYAVLCLGFIGVHVGYSLTKRHVSTVVPCANSIWYKLYTVLLMALAVAAFIVGSIETVQYPNGTFNSQPPLNCQNNTCMINETDWIGPSDKSWRDFLAHFDNLHY